MKKFVLFLSACFAINNLYAQIQTPSHWSTSTSLSEANIGDELDLIFSVKIDNMWYLYSTEFICEDGPLKTTFDFIPHKSYQLIGGVIPIHPKDKHDDIFDCDIKLIISQRK